MLCSRKGESFSNKVDQELTHPPTRMDLEKSTLSERTGHEGPLTVRLRLQEMSRIGKSVEVESLVVPQGWEPGGLVKVVAEESLYRVMKVSQIGCDGSYTTL